MLLLALLVTAGVVALFVWQPWNAQAQGPAGTPTVTETGAPDASPTPGASAAASPTVDASAASTPEPVSTEDASELEACSTRDITVYAETDQESYGAGQLPQLSMTLTNNGESACLMDVGTATQEFKITSGSDTWWRSTDCQSESSNYVVQIAAGQTVSSTEAIEWDRTRSSVDTCDTDRPQAGAGTYHLEVSIGGIQAADTAMFLLG